MGYNEPGNEHRVVRGTGMQAEAPGTAGIRLAELVAAWSLATDLGTGQPMQHALRACLLASRLGEAPGLNEARIRVFSDTLGLMQQLGLAPVPGTVAA
jgi:hypothetical protein